MKPKKILCLFSTLIPLLTFSQITPHIEVRGTDTCAVVPVQQLRIANAKFVEMKQCNEEKDSLYSQVKSYGGLVNNLRDAVNDLKEANKFNETIIADKQKVIELSDKEIKKLQRKQKWLKIQRTALGGASVILTSIVLVLIK